jgi:hypothetical protein
MRNKLNLLNVNEGTTPLVSYIYDGSGNPMQTTYNQPDVSLSYINGGAFVQKFEMT